MIVDPLMKALPATDQEAYQSQLLTTILNWEGVGVSLQFQCDDSKAQHHLSKKMRENRRKGQEVTRMTTKKKIEEEEHQTGEHHLFESVPQPHHHIYQL